MLIHNVDIYQETKYLGTRIQLRDSFRIDNIEKTKNKFDIVFGNPPFGTWARY